MHTPMNTLCLKISFCAVALNAGLLAQPILHMNATDGSTLELDWETAEGQQYRLEQSGDLVEWDPVEGYPQVGSGLDKNYVSDTLALPAFFRVSTDPQQLFYVPFPDDGLRYDAYEEFDGPRWPAVYGEGHVTLWHKGKFSAYSITIDDNNSPDFPFWLEVGETYGWRLTWFVIVYPYTWDIYNDKPGNNTGYFGTLAEWKTLHDLGHDIQLHGACGSMNNQTNAEYEDQIVRSINVMEEATGTKILTFAYPCGKLTNPAGTEDYLEIIKRYTISARGGVGNSVASVHRTNYHTVPGIGVNELTDGGPNTLFTRYDDRRSYLYSSYRGWVVTLYHGISDEAPILETLDWVKAHEDEFWVAAYTDVAKYAQQRETATLDIGAVATTRIEYTVSDRMDDAIFDHPLTVKIRVDSTWSDVSATQDGQAITAYIVQHEGNNYVYSEPVPDRGLVVLTKMP